MAPTEFQIYTCKAQELPNAGMLRHDAVALQYSKLRADFIWEFRVEYTGLS